MYRYYNVTYYIISNNSIFSSFFLTLNENSSQMLLHDVNDPTHYKNYIRIPTYPQSLRIKIEDIHSSGKEICGKYCSLLIAVRCVSY